MGKGAELISPMDVRSSIFILALTRYILHCLVEWKRSACQVDASDGTSELAVVQGLEGQ